MSLDALFQPSTDRALRAMAELPPPPPTIDERSAWRAVPALFQGAAAGLTEAAAGLQGLTRIEPTDPTREPSELRKQEEERWRIRYGERTQEQVMRDAAHALRPDPVTAGTAERIAFDAARLLTKAVAHVATAGPAGGALLTGLDEGATVTDDLVRRQGVDPATARQVGAVAGVAAGAGVILPIAGNTVARTVGLYAVGGPGMFVAQQAATSAILEASDYHELAQQYDPLDPTGLAVSALFPLPFAALGIRANVRAARAKPTQEQLDAAMTQNLTLQRDVHESTAIDDAVRRIDGGMLATDRELAAARVDHPAEPAVLEEIASFASEKPEVTEPKAGDLAAAIERVSETVDDQAAAGAADPQSLAKSLAARVAEVEEKVPDMVVRTSEDGKAVTVADELARIRREAAEGTDDALGAADAGLLEVAANCALSLG